MLARKMLSAVKEDRGADVFARLYKPQEAVNLLTILAKKEFHLPHRLPEDLADHVKAAMAEKREEERRIILSSLSRIVKTGESDALAPSSKKPLSKRNGVLKRLTRLPMIQHGCVCLKPRSFLEQTPRQGEGIC